jgi:hypothetical protein
MSLAPFAAKLERPRYVGYAQIAATGLDKRQIQRLVSRGKFPGPDRDGLVPCQSRRQPRNADDDFRLTAGCKAFAITMDYR